MVLSEQRYSFTKLRKLTYVCMVGGTNLPPTIQTSPKFREFGLLYVCSVRFQQINFKLGNLTTHLKALFPLGLTDFPQLVHVKSLKKTLKGLLLLIHKIFLGTLALTFLISDIGLVSFEWNITSYVITKGKRTYKHFMIMKRKMEITT